MVCWLPMACLMASKCLLLLWVTYCVGTLLYGYLTVWVPYCVGNILYGQITVWLIAVWFKLLCEQYAVWVNDCGVNIVWVICCLVRSATVGWTVNWSSC